MSGDRLEYDIIRLRKEGLPNSEIADRLNVSCKTVEGRVTQLIGEGKIERRSVQRKQKISDDDVVRFRKEGLSNQEIADKLGVSIRSVEKRVSRLIGVGNVEKRNASHEERHRPLAEMEDDIIRLRRLGYSNDDICSVLDIPSSTYNRWVIRLINEGKTEKVIPAVYKPEPKPEIESGFEPEPEPQPDIKVDGRYDVRYMSRDEIDGVVVCMRNEGKMNNEIAIALNSTLGAIGVRCSRLLSEGRIQRRGIGGSQHHRTFKDKVDDDIILQMRKDGFTLSQIAERFGMTKNQVGYRCTKLIEAGKLPRNVVGNYGPRKKSKSNSKPKKRGRKPVEVDEDVIIRMRKDGYANWEIAAELEVLSSVIEKRITKLIREGKVEKREWKRKAKESVREESTDEIVDEDDDDEDYLQW